MQLTFFLLLSIGGLSVLTSAGNFKEDFYKGFTILTREGRETLELKNALDGVKFPHLFRGNYRPKQRNDISTFVCMACDLALDIIITASQSDVSADLIVDAMYYLCVNLGIEGDDVCRGALQMNKDTLYFIMRDKDSKANSERMCSMLLQDFKCFVNSTEPWTIKIPPPVTEELVQVFVQNDAETEPIKVIQLTDLHYDPNYEVGSNADCREPLCCQAGTKPATPEAAAGYWGDYRDCDVPWHNIIDILDQIVIEHKNIDYVYFTGDIVNHKIWQTDISGNKKAIEKVYKQFKKTFGNIPIFPILGNHEPHPVNQFSHVLNNSHELSTEWIFKLAAEQWSQWLPQDTQDTILKGGYYTVKTKGGPRIIALNSNVCYTFNFWLFYNDKDPFDQLQWLANTLAEAEKNKEKVHILSHVPTGDSTCLHNWSNEFVKIVNRFSHIISAQFNGHTHNDDTVLFYGANRETPVSIAFNGGSITTYSNLNPNYKVYYLDPKTYNVQDYESWVYNLTEANWDPQIPPKWHKLYSFKQQYNLNEVTPLSVSRLVEEMAMNPTTELNQAYFRNKNREADTALAEGCDADCEINNLCYMVTYVHGNDYHCKQMTDAYNTARPPKY